MPDLNLPEASFNIKKQGDKEFIFDCLRKQYVRLTPEEYVRQRFIHFLITYKRYPAGLLANEVCIAYGNVNRRCDTVLYDRELKALMIIEYKAPAVSISQKTFDQIVRYTMALHVPWLVVTNGLEHYCCMVGKDGKYLFIKEIPEYGQL